MQCTITYLIDSVTVVLFHRFIFYELEPGLCLSLVSPGERSSLLSFPLLRHVLPSTEDGSRIFLQPALEMHPEWPRLAPLWCPMGLSSPYHAPPGSSGSETRISYSDRKHPRLFGPTAVASPIFGVHKRYHKQNQEKRGLPFWLTIVVPFLKPVKSSLTWHESYIPCSIVGPRSIFFFRM